VLQKGDRVFYADNSKDYLTRCDVFQRTVHGRGLVPVFYGGVGKIVRESNVDQRMRDDFYTAQAIVLYFGSPKEGSNDDDHWALHEIGHATASGASCLVYISKDFPREILLEHSYDGMAEVLSTEADFGAALQRDLAKLLAS
jgi:hypothetical protein